MQRKKPWHTERLGGGVGRIEGGSVRSSVSTTAAGVFDRRPGRNHLPRQRSEGPCWRSWKRMCKRMKGKFYIMIRIQNSLLVILGIIAFSFCTTSKKATKDVANTTQVLQKMRLANQYFMDKWPDPGKETVTDKVRPSNIWTRAVYYEGLMALYSIDPQNKYYDYAVDWGQ